VNCVFIIRRFGVQIPVGTQAYDPVIIGIARVFYFPESALESNGIMQG